MKKITFSITPYKIPFINNKMRSGLLICATDELGVSAFGEIAPLPNWSKETLEEALTQLNHKKKEIQSISWNIETCFENLKELSLFPSVLFGLETALLSLLDPLPAFTPNKSALLMGSFKEILAQAKDRKKQGYKSAKLKVSSLSFQEAEEVILLLQKSFFLRIDVNRSWAEQDSLKFFSRFSPDAFDYVEEPFQDPTRLFTFTHPLAVDESFPSPLSLKDLKKLPTLKALIYKPMMQGGLTNALSLKKKGLNLILSSSFETSIGLRGIENMAKRLDLSSPIGTGTSHFLPCPFQDKIVNS
jgi:o-succinylbenzoate synthase